MENCLYPWLQISSLLISMVAAAAAVQRLLASDTSQVEGVILKRNQVILKRNRVILTRNQVILKRNRVI